MARRIPNPSFAYDILRSIDKIGGCEEKLIILDLSHRNNTALLLRQVWTLLCIIGFSETERMNECIGFFTLKIIDCIFVNTANNF